MDAFRMLHIALGVITQRTTDKAAEKTRFTKQQGRAARRSWAGCSLHRSALDHVSKVLELLEADGVRTWP